VEIAIKIIITGVIAIASKRSEYLENDRNICIIAITSKRNEYLENDRNIYINKYFYIFI
jgi:hypothetical protein